MTKMILPGTRVDPPPDADHLRIDHAELDQAAAELIPPWLWTRISVAPRDAAFTMVAYAFEVRLDGRLLDNVVTADSREGVVIRHPAPPPAGKRVAFEDVPTEVLRGKVELRWTGPRDETWQTAGVKL